MFTGLVQGMGEVVSAESRGGDCRLTIRASGLFDTALDEGESIAVNGVCLTAMGAGDQVFSADVSRETLGATTLGELRPGTAVNLERSLVLGQSLGGHLVTGHVDGIAELESTREDARSRRLVIKVPERLARYVATKGSVCLDGVSLTVNEVRGSSFGVNIVPHTLDVTNLGRAVPGTRLNVEVDIIARYLERLLEGRETGRGDIDYALLTRLGFGRGQE